MALPLAPSIPSVISGIVETFRGPGPTWSLVSQDSFTDFLVGQFDPKIQDTDGAPMWQRKPGILGGLPWIKYIGKEIGQLSFEFYFLSTNILDKSPENALAVLRRLSDFDQGLGRPPRVMFIHGSTIAEGFITEVPEVPIEHWGNGPLGQAKLIHSIGPIRVTITKVPRENALPSILTGYSPITEETSYEELARSQYGDARFAQSLAIHNQGRKLEETAELPSSKSGLVTRTVPISPLMADGITGL